MKRLLGKNQARYDRRNLRLAKYLLPAVAVPTEVSWIMQVPKWPMFLNDAIGDCVPAASAHMVQQWSFYANPPGFTPAGSDVLRAYEAVGGYDPRNPATDQGADMLTMLNYWRKTGVGGHKIAAYVQVDPHNRAEVMMAAWLFGNVYAGFQLPLSVQATNFWTVPTGGILTPDGDLGSWGGHCVPIMAASPQTLTCVTWGERLKMSWNFLTTYCDEAYAVLSLDWIEKSGASKNGFDFATLLKDLAAL